MTSPSKHQPYDGLGRDFRTGTKSHSILKTEHMKIAIIGAGNLGLSIAKGLIINNTYTDLYLTKRNLDTIREFEEYKSVFLTTNNN